MLEVDSLSPRALAGFGRRRASGKGFGAVPFWGRFCSASARSAFATCAVSNLASAAISGSRRVGQLVAPSSMTPRNRCMA
jgi:hypothetical protein